MAGKNDRRSVLLIGAVVALATAAVVLVVERSLHSSSSTRAPVTNRTDQLRDGPAASSPSAATATAIVQPRDGATSVPLDSTVLVTAVDGATLTTVQARAGDGTLLAGTLDASSVQWQSGSPLEPNAHYTVTARLVVPGGQELERTSQFSTLQPVVLLHAGISPSDGLTVGVGMPVQIRFDHPILRTAAVQAAVHLTESVPVAGGWHWFSTTELHFRPSAPWPPGEQVTVQVALDGVDAGNGIWGDGNQVVRFVVGDAHVATADVTRHTLTVTTNGQVVATYPLSAGRTKYPTMNGRHIALYRRYDVLMDSATVGIPRNSPDGYYEHVFWNVNITDGGEFVHAAPWSVGSQGRSNVSHGCINLSPANAKAFFEFSRVGDIIDVVGSSRGPSLTDHGTMDWTLPSAGWTA